MFMRHDVRRNACQLFGTQAKCGYDWWWHSFTAVSDATGEARAFYIEYFLCSPEKGGSAPVFGQLPEAREKGIKPSYVMVNAGTWGDGARQLHRFFAWDETDVSFGVPYRVSAGDCLATEDRIKGSIDVSARDAACHPEWMSDAGQMAWDIRVDKQIAFNVGYGAGALMRRLQLFEMFWHAEGMKTAYTGTIVYNGERYTVSPETCFGYADKNWGRDFTTPWLWLSSCDMVSEITGRRLENSVFDIGGGRPKIGPIALTGKLLGAFFYEGREFEFNFTKPLKLPRTRFSCRETDDEIVWHVDQRTLFTRMVTDVRCKKSDMLKIRYESPNGAMRHTRLWNGGTGEGVVELYRKGRLVDRIRVGHVGCEYGEYDADAPYK